MSAPDDFEEFVAARYAALVRTARLLSATHEDAEDLVQSTLARCVPAWDRIAGDPEPYVRTVLVRENVSRWRRRRWREVTVDAVPDTPVLQAQGWDRPELVQALARLAPRQRAAVVLRHVEDLSEAETARLMGCSVGAVKSQCHAGLARLRTLLPGLGTHGDACAVVEAPVA
ncbi:SigE family RNA polymerase sigma factor [Nocardioides sp. P5_C9_2]